MLLFQMLASLTTFILFAAATPEHAGTAGGAVQLADSDLSGASARCSRQGKGCKFVKCWRISISRGSFLWDLAHGRKVSSH
jgi:hypothetical protein